jgi:NAD(P)-dependent dehydrogenase (short-subunit alcohol dehydrogenase family)
MTSRSGSRRTVVVSGAASGMGNACARRFQSDGWNVVGIDVESIDSPGQGLIYCRADVTDAKSLEKALSQLQPRLGPIHGVVNAAGIYPTSNLTTLTTELYRRIFDVNVLGTLLVVQAVLPMLAEGASIVNFASIDAFTAPSNQLVYTASKAAVVGATKALAGELAARGVRVNAIAPGWVRTPSISSARLAAALPNIPLKRVAEPEEIAETVFWLTTGVGAQYITGETIVSSGGLVMR